jgi:phage terminase large subunit
VGEDRYRWESHAPSGPLYRAATTERHLWHFIEIDGDPDKPRRSSRISVQWAKEQIEKYGRDNPWVLVNVFGKFPPSSLDALVGVEEVQEAMRRSPPEDQYSFAARVLGVDAARFGDDPWIIFPRQGRCAFPPVEMRGPRRQEAAGRIASAWDRWDADACFVDDTGGFGGGAIDMLLDTGYAPQGINFSSKATNPRYYNKRSEMHFERAQWVKAGGALPHVPELVAELTTPTSWIDGGRLRLEEKAQIKARLGRSPNYADALALTFAEPVAPRGTDWMLKRSHTRALTEYEPFAPRAPQVYGAH